MNDIIREAKSKKRMFNYEIAELLGVSESTFGRMMRNEIPLEEQKRIADLILSSNASMAGAYHDRTEG